MENLYWPTLFFKSLLRNSPCITTPRQQNESCYSPAGRACRPQGSYLCRRSVNRPLSTAPIWLTGWSTALTAVTAISTIYVICYTLCVVGRVWAVTLVKTRSSGSPARPALCVPSLAHSTAIHNLRQVSKVCGRGRDGGVGRDLLSNRVLLCDFTYRWPIRE